MKNLRKYVAGFRSGNLENQKKAMIYYVFMIGVFFLGTSWKFNEFAVLAVCLIFPSVWYNFKSMVSGEKGYGIVFALTLLLFIFTYYIALSTDESYVESSNVVEENVQSDKESLEMNFDNEEIDSVEEDDSNDENSNEEISDFTIVLSIILSFVFGTMLFMFLNRIFIIRYWGCKGLIATYLVCIAIASSLFEMLFFEDSEDDSDDYSGYEYQYDDNESYINDYASSEENISSNQYDSYGSSGASDVINLKDIYEKSFDSSYSSSELYDEYDVSYNSNNVLDGNSSTTWSEGVSGSGIGEYILLKNDNNKVLFDTIGIVNGNSKKESLYYLNNRVKTLELEFDDGTTQIIELSDNTMDKQVFSVGRKMSSYVKISILDVYTGSRYDDTCISDIFVSYSR